MLYTACGSIRRSTANGLIRHAAFTDGFSEKSPGPDTNAAMSTPSNNTIDADLLSILRCPLTRSVLHQEGDFLVAEVGGLRYPVRDGIPVMLVEEAKLPAGVDSLDAFKTKYRQHLVS